MNGGAATIDPLQGATDGNLLDWLQQLATRASAGGGISSVTPSAAGGGAPSGVSGMLGQLLTGAATPPQASIPALTSPLGSADEGPTGSDALPAFQMPSTMGDTFTPAAPAAGSALEQAVTGKGATPAPTSPLEGATASADPAPAAPDATPGAPATPAEQQLELAQLHAADPSKGFGTPYYGVYTDQGDLSATLAPGEGARVRLVDPHTGEVLAEGTGMQGAQQIATLANAVSKSLGKTAAYNIQQERGAGTDDFQTFQAEDVDHPHANFLKTLIQIAGPLLGAAIPGLAPFIGAGLGGAGASLATGGGLKGALLGALTGSLGNLGGAALSGALGGTPAAAISLTSGGTNALGGLLHAGQGLLSGLTSPGATGALASTAADFTPAELAGAVSPLTVTAGLGPASVLGGLTGTALGGAAGSVLNGGGGVNSLTGSAGQDTVQPDQGAPDEGAGDPAGSPNGLPKWLIDTVGQTIGGTAADVGVLGTAALLGGGGGGGGGGAAPGAGLDPTGLQGVPTPALDGSSDPAPDATSTPIVPPPTSPLSSVGGSGTPGGGAVPQASALGQALANSGAGGAAGGAPIGAPDFNTQGSTAPDIYPWQNSRWSRIGARPR